MKKNIILSFAALAAILSGCSKAEVPTEATNDDEITITVGAAICGDTRTQFVPDGGKVLWLKGDQLGLKFKKTEDTKTKNDNQQLTLVSGEGTQYAFFSGKITPKNDALPADGNFVFYYPKHTTVAETGSVSDIDNFTLGHKFPKIQNTADVLFEANYMYGIAKGVENWPDTSEAKNIPVNVKMKNAMAVIDFTIKGEGKIEKLFLTDLDETAQAMFGLDKIKIVNGEVDSITFSASKSVADRTIEADFNIPVELTADGSHVYVTVAPRTFAKGIKVCFMLTDGDYMIKTIGTDKGFTVASGKSYTAPVASFASSKTEGKGYGASGEYSFTTITDARDGEVYRVATLADGNTWMIDNLRYLPDDITPSNTLTGGKPVACAGVWFPVVINAAGNGVQFGTADDVKKYGYVYNMAVAFGEDIEYIDDMQKDMVIEKTLTQTAAIAEVNGKTASICPTGWSLPTKTQYSALYTACGSTLAGLEAYGFELTGFGSVSVTNISAAGVLPTSGSLSGYANNKMNTNYILLANSAIAAKTGSIGIFSFTGIMTNRNNNTAVATSMLARTAGAIRCIKDAE